MSLKLVTFLTTKKPFMSKILQKVLIFTKTSLSQNQTKKNFNFDTKAVISLQATNTCRWNSEKKFFRNIGGGLTWTCPQFSQPSPKLIYIIQLWFKHC